MSHGADRQRLVGLIALENGLIDREQFGEGLRAWSGDASRPLGDHLETLGFLDRDGWAAADAQSLLAFATSTSCGPTPTSPRSARGPNSSSS